MPRSFSGYIISKREKYGHILQIRTQDYPDRTLIFMITVPPKYYESQFPCLQIFREPITFLLGRRNMTNIHIKAIKYCVYAYPYKPTNRTRPDKTFPIYSI